MNCSRFVRSGLTAVFISFAACGGGDGTPTLPSAPTVSAIRISPAGTRLWLGKSQTLTAQAIDASGAVVSSAIISWNSANTAVASVSASGVVTAISVGSTTATASSGGKSAAATVDAVLAPIGRVELTATRATMLIGTSQQVNAVVRDSLGDVLTSRAVAWSASPTSIATVSSAGVVTAIGAGRASITATVEGVIATTPVDVVPVPVAQVIISPITLSIAAASQRQFVATARDSVGNTLPAREVQWSTTNAAVLTISSTGLASAVATGTAMVTANVEGRTASATVTVTPAPIASIALSLPSSPVVRSVARAVAQPRDAAGNVLASRTISWQSSDTTVASVDAAGEIFTLSAGQATITASAEGQSVAATLTVAASALPIRGLYTTFDKRGFPNGYYSGDAIQTFTRQDPDVPSLGIVRDEIARQLDAMRALGVNSITFELRSSNPVWEEFRYPSCNISPSIGLFFPSPPPADLDNLVAFLDLVQSKGMKVMLRLVNTYMDEAYRQQSTTWLNAILSRVKGHSALELVLFEGDERFRDSDGNGTKDECGIQAEPPLFMGPDRPAAQYVQWAIAYAMSLGYPARQLSAQGIIGAYVIDMELGAGRNFQNSRQWHTLGVMKTIFDRLGVPDDQRTYAISMYQARRCQFASGYACTDAAPSVWAEETIKRAWSKVGLRSRARMVAVEFGSNYPVATNYNADQAFESSVLLMRKYGMEGGAFWRWVNYTNAEDADSQNPWAVKWRGAAPRYTPVADVMRRLYLPP